MIWRLIKAVEFNGMLLVKRKTKIVGVIEPRSIKLFVVPRTEIYCLPATDLAVWRFLYGYSVPAVDAFVAVNKCHGKFDR